MAQILTYKERAFYEDEPRGIADIARLINNDKNAMNGFFAYYHTLRRISKGEKLKKKTLLNYRLLAYLRGDILEFFANDANFEADGITLKIKGRGDDSV